MFSSKSFWPSMFKTLSKPSFKGTSVLKRLPSVNQLQNLGHKIFGNSQTDHIEWMQLFKSRPVTFHTSWCDFHTFYPKDTFAQVLPIFEHNYRIKEKKQSLFNIIFHHFPSPNSLCKYFFVVHFLHLIHTSLLFSRIKINGQWLLFNSHKVKYNPK